jgi:hypothetical protein
VHGVLPFRIESNANVGQDRRASLVHGAGREGTLYTFRVLFSLPMRIVAIVTRPIWHRILISTWALWLAAALAEVGPLGSCPKHGHHGLPAPAATAHVAHQAHGSSATLPSGHQDPSHAACTCIGQCCCVPSIALPNVTTSVVAAIAIRVDVVTWPSAVVAHARAPYSLPFANGPPVTRSV